MNESGTPEEVTILLRGVYKEALSGIIAIDGVDGVGKSHLAEKLHKLIGGGILSLDNFLERKDESYVQYLNLAAIKAAIEGCATPKIIEGCCLLEVFELLDFRQNVLIYVKHITSNPMGGYYWIHHSMIDPTESTDDAIGQKNRLKTELIRYHVRYRPHMAAQIAFLNTPR